MASQWILLLACAAAAQAGVVPAVPLAYAPALAPAEVHAPEHHPVHYATAPLAYGPAATPVVYAKAVAIDTEYDPHPEYKFAYDVQDDHTGDSKSQHESRSGDVVHGSYSLDDPDGTRRTVDYTADSIHGFNAVVHKAPQTKRVIALPVAYAAAPVAYHPAAYHR